jgi:cytochrome c-type biogenesis protein
MDSLFTILSDALSGNILFALAASFGWGVLSIVLSPCHLSSIPLVVGFLAAKGEKKTSRGILLSLVFAAGVLITIAIIGTITGVLGRIMGDVGSWGKYLVAVVFFVVGLYLMDVIRLPASGGFLRPLQIRSVTLSALVLGLIFGIALGPCTFAFMAPVLGVVFELSHTNAVAAGALLIAFGLGHCAVIVITGGLATRVQAYLDWTNKSNVILWTKRVAGFLVLIGGAYITWS